MSVVTISGVFGQRDCFARGQPASAELRAETELARTVVDHGSFFLGKLLDNDQATFGLRDWVIMALLRRILITGEAVGSLLERGLEEPGSATFRTLLELERNLRLVLADPTERCARRLAAYGVQRSRRHFKRAAKHPETRQWLCRVVPFFEWFKRRSRTFRDWLESDEFHDITEEVRQTGDWHGFKNQEEAFERAGVATDYHLGGFEGTSLFVHATNIDYDFVDDKGIRLKPVVQRGTSLAGDLLGQLTLRMIEIYTLIWEDRGKPEYQQGVIIEDEQGNTRTLSALIALQAIATRASSR